jgi:hypothetical protein
MGRIVDAVLIQDQRIGEGADLEDAGLGEDQMK